MLRRVGQGLVWTVCMSGPYLRPCRGPLGFGSGPQGDSHLVVRSRTMSLVASSIGPVRSSRALEPRPASAHLVSTCGCRPEASQVAGLHKVPTCRGRTIAEHFVQRTMRPPVRFHWKIGVELPRRSSGAEAAKSGQMGCVLRKQAPQEGRHGSTERWFPPRARRVSHPVGVQARLLGGEASLVD